MEFELRHVRRLKRELREQRKESRRCRSERAGRRDEGGRRERTSAGKVSAPRSSATHLDKTSY